MSSRKAQEGSTIMAKETTYAGMRGDWQRLSTMLSANTPELGHLETQRLRLEGLLARAMEITMQQGIFKAGKQETSKQLQGVMAEGQRLATVLRQSVKEHYGPTSEKLHEFGVQPFRGRKAKAAPEEPEGPAARAHSAVPDPDF
jgi:hypothetical protein